MKTFVFRCSVRKLSGFQTLLETAFFSKTPCELLVTCRDCCTVSSETAEDSEILSLSEESTSFPHLLRRELPMSNSRYWIHWSSPILVDFSETIRVDSKRVSTVVFHISTTVSHVLMATMQKFSLLDTSDRLQPYSVDISIRCDWNKQPFFNLLPNVDFAQADWSTLPESGDQVIICRRTALQIFKFIDYLTRLDARDKSPECLPRKKNLKHQILHIDIAFDYLDYILQYVNELVTIENFYYSPSSTRAICVFRTSSRPKLVLEVAPRYISTKAGFEFDLVTGFTTGVEQQQHAAERCCVSTGKDKDDNTASSILFGSTEPYRELQQDFREWKSSKSLDPTKLFRLCQPFDRFEWTFNPKK